MPWASTFCGCFASRQRLFIEGHSCNDHWHSIVISKTLLKCFTLSEQVPLKPRCSLLLLHIGTKLNFVLQSVFFSWQKLCAISKSICCSMTISMFLFWRVGQKSEPISFLLLKSVVRSNHQGPSVTFFNVQLIFIFVLICFRILHTLLWLFIQQTGEGTPTRTGYLEVQIVGGKLLHSKKVGSQL